MLMTPLSRSISLLFAMILAPAAFGASDEHDAAADAGDHAAGHEFHPNHIGLFLGITHGGEAQGSGREENTFTVGLDYERHLVPLLGVGLSVDYLAGERREYAIAFPMFFHAGDARFYVAPGWERTTDSPRRPKDNDFLLRLGFLYDFSVSNMVTLAPAVAVDHVNGENLLVLGFGIGWGF